MGDMQMDAFAALMTRRSVRPYTNTLVSDHQFRKIGRRAASNRGTSWSYTRGSTLTAWQRCWSKRESRRRARSRSPARAVLQAAASSMPGGSPAARSQTRAT
jgi:hypothetical protein